MFFLPIMKHFILIVNGTTTTDNHWTNIKVYSHGHVITIHIVAFDYVFFTIRRSKSALNKKMRKKENRN